MDIRIGALAGGRAASSSRNRAGAIAGPKAPGASLAPGDALELGPPKLGRDVIARLIENGKTIRVRNEQGGEATVAAASLGNGKYRLTLDGTPIEVRINAGLPANEALSRIAGYLSQLPLPMREGVTRFEVRKKDGGDAAATTYNGHRVVFWSGMDYLRPSTFFHEMGHVNAKRLFGHTDPSDVWDRAQTKDRERITDYAGTNDNEDFAEMIEAYWLAKRGDGPTTLDDLRTKFPERMKLVEAIVAGKHVDTKDSDYWPVFGFQIPKPATLWQKLDGPELWEKSTRWLSNAANRLASLNPLA